MQLLSSDTELPSEDKNDASLDAVGRQLLGALGWSPGMADLDIFSEFTTLGSSEHLSEFVEPFNGSTSSKGLSVDPPSHGFLDTNHNRSNEAHHDLFNAEMTMFPGVLPYSKEEQEQWPSLQGIPTPVSSELPPASGKGTYPSLQPRVSAEKDNNNANISATDPNLHLHHQQSRDPFQEWISHHTESSNHSSSIAQYTPSAADMAHARSMSLNAMPVVHGSILPKDSQEHMYEQCHASVAQGVPRRFHPYASLRSRSMTDAPRARHSEEPWLQQTWTTQWNVQPPIQETAMTSSLDMTTAQVDTAVPNAGLSSAVSTKSPEHQRSHSSMSLERTMAWLATLADDINDHPQSQPSRSDQKQIQTSSFTSTAIPDQPSQLEYAVNTDDWNLHSWMESLQPDPQQPGGQPGSQQHQQQRQTKALSGTPQPRTSEHAKKEYTLYAEHPRNRDAYAAYTPHQATQLAALKAMAQQAQELLQTPDYRHPASRGGDMANRARYTKHQESTDPQRQRRRAAKPKAPHPMQPANSSAPFNLEAIYRAQEEYNAQRLKQEEGEHEQHETPSSSGGLFCKYPPASTNNFICPSKRMKKDAV